MSAPTQFAPLDLAREVLANRQFSSTDRTKTKTIHGTASNKRAAATTWLDYIGEGYNPDQADALLRKDGPGLALSANEIATGARVARECLKLGYSRAPQQKLRRIDVPVDALPEAIEVLQLRPNLVHNGPGKPYQNGYASRGATAVTYGDKLAIRLLPGDPRTDKIEALAA